jgi:ABC-type multidrug transport system fused ATPase/permease subunit
MGLYLFIGLTVLSVVFTFIRASVLLIVGNNQSKLVHDRMIKGLLYADLSTFFNRVPVGRIVNRLTKDLRELDEVIMQFFAFVLIGIFQLLGALFICVYAATPYALIPMVFVFFLSEKLRKYYLKSQKEVARF